MLLILKLRPPLRSPPELVHGRLQQSEPDAQIPLSAAMPMLHLQQLCFSSARGGSHCAHPRAGPESLETWSIKGTETPLALL